MSDEVYFCKGNNIYYGNPDKPEFAETISLKVALEELNELRELVMVDYVEVDLELDVETYIRLSEKAKKLGMSKERFINKLVEDFDNEKE